MQKIRQISVGDSVVGLSMLEQIFEYVADAGHSQDADIRRELIRQVKIYNYVPAPAEATYADAIFAEYQKEMMK